MPHVPPRLSIDDDLRVEFECCVDTHCRANAHVSFAADAQINGELSKKIYMSSINNTTPFLCNMQ